MEVTELPRKSGRDSHERERKSSKNHLKQTR